MDAIQREKLWKFFLSCVRSVMTLVSGFLLMHGYLTQEQSDTLLAAENVEIAAGVILYFAPRFWAWAKVNFEVYFPRKARDAPPDTPLTQIKRETFKDKDTPNFMTSA